MKVRLPRFMLFAVVLLGVTNLAFLLIYTKSLLAPLAFAFLFALLLYPVCARLERWRLPRGLAVMVCLLLMVSVVGGIIFLISNQVLSFRHEIPELTQAFYGYVDTVQDFIEVKTGIRDDEQGAYLKNSIREAASTGGRVLASTAGATTATLAAMALVPIYIFFFLYYRDFFREFLYRLFARRKHGQLGKVLSQIQGLIQSYITGLITVILIISVLNSVGLLVLGVRHALFFGFLAGLLNIIPYVGVFIGSLLPIAYALVTMDSPWYAAGVAAIFWVVQFAEGNFITPNIVGSKVSLNPLVAIVALLIGGMIWGPAGMIIAMPFTAILKVLFDNTPNLEPYGFLMGEPGREADDPTKAALVPPSLAEGGTDNELKEKVSVKETAGVPEVDQPSRP
ncbi:MAG: AI-2E family transporter [Catalinimonas sp.]